MWQGGCTRNRARGCSNRPTRCVERVAGRVGMRHALLVMADRVVVCQRTSSAPRLQPPKVVSGRLGAGTVTWQSHCLLRKSSPSACREIISNIYNDSLIMGPEKRVHANNAVDVFSVRALGNASQFGKRNPPPVVECHQDRPLALTTFWPANINLSSHCTIRTRAQRSFGAPPGTQGCYAEHINEIAPWCWFWRAHDI